MPGSGHQGKNLISENIFANYTIYRWVNNFEKRRTGFGIFWDFWIFGISWDFGIYWDFLGIFWDLLGFS